MQSQQRASTRTGVVAGKGEGVVGASAGQAAGELVVDARAVNRGVCERRHRYENMRIQIEVGSNAIHILFARQYWPATDHWHSGSRLQLVRELTEMHGKSVQLFVLKDEFAL